MNGDEKTYHSVLDGVMDVSKEALEPSAEKLIEMMTKIDIPDSIPVLGTAKSILDVFRCVHDKLALKRIKKMRDAMLLSDEADRFYANMSKKEKGRLADLLISEIEKQTNELQSEALGHLARAYVCKEIGYDDFLGVASELKNVNPVVFGGDERVQLFQEASGFIFGSYDLLPSIFTADHSPIDNSIMADPGRRYLTDLGRCFYYCVYEKMIEVGKINNEK